MGLAIFGLVEDGPTLAGSEADAVIGIRHVTASVFDCASVRLISPERSFGDQESLRLLSVFELLMLFSAR